MSFTPAQLSEAFAQKTFTLPNGNSTSVRKCLSDIHLYVWHGAQIRDEDKTRDEQISGVVAQLANAINALQLTPSELASITQAAVANTLDSGEVEVRVDVATPEED